MSPLGDDVLFVVSPCLPLQILVFLLSCSAFLAADLASSFAEKKNKESKT
jgi:hypothetical protein